MQKLSIILVLLFPLALLSQDKPLVDGPALVINRPLAIDFTAKLYTVGNKPIVRDSASKEAMTLGDAAVEALESITDEDRNAPAAKKFERDRLARKVYQQSAVVLSVEEVAEIKDRIGKLYGAAVIGAAWPLLDPSLDSRSK
jgi:hypothetical protein